MKQTSFFWQVLLGLRQEFQSFLNHPSKLFFFYSTVILFTFINIWECTFCSVTFIISLDEEPDETQESNGVKGTILNAKDLSLLPLFYLGPEIVLSQKFVQEQKFKIKNFLKTNGMKISAYTTKTLLACYILLLPVSLAKVLEVYSLNSFYRNHHEQKTLLFGVFINHFITGFAIVNLNFFVSRTLKEKYIIPLILIRAILPFYCLIFSYALDTESTLFAFIGIITGLFNPTTPLTNSITDLSKRVFCAPACFSSDSTSTNITSHPNKYSNYTQCQELFLGDLESVTADIDDYCDSKEYENWLFYLKAIFIAGFTYLALLLLLNQVDKFKAWRLKKRTQRAQSIAQMGNQHPLMSTYDISLSLDVTEQDFTRERQQTLLQDPNIKVRKEEILCILGENGSGQSTLARILAGLSSPLNGSIIYNNLEYKQEELDSLIGYCSQKDVPLLDNTINENLKFFAQLKGTHQNLEEIRDQVGLTKHDGSLLVSELSPDQKMMLNMAILLLSDPQIIIMDDPTAELDSSTKVTFRKLLKHLKTLKEKKTIIYTAQSVKDAELADRVALLEKDGNSSGTLSQIKEKKLQGQYVLVISIRGEEAVRLKTKQTVQEILEKYLKNHILLDGTIDSILKYKVSYPENKEKLRELFNKLANINNIEINFKRLNLDEYLEKLQNYGVLSQQENVKIIPASKESSIKTQIWAIFCKRLYTWNRRKILILLLFLLDSFLFGSFFIAKYYLEEDYLAFFNFLLSPLLFSVILCGFIKMIFTGSELIVHRQSYQAHTLNIMGLNPWAFWIGNLLADFLSQLPLIILSVILTQQIDAENLSERILLIISTIALHINIIVFIYSLSINQWVKNLQSILLITFFTFLMSIVTSKFAVFILDLFGLNQEIISLLFCTFLELIIGSLIILYSLPPFFQIIVGMHIISGIVNRIFDKFQEPPQNSWAPTHQIIVLVMTWLSVFMTLLCIVLKKSADFKKSQSKNKLIPEPIKPTNSKVIDEQNRVQSLDNTDFLKFTNVHKKEALISDSKVLDLTFGIPKGSTLALVGNNRGGKSEVLDLYGRETFVSSGKISLQGEKLPCPPYNSSAVKIGFCLSTNAFWEDLSVWEHLKIYAMIKGIPSSMIKEAVWGIMNGLDLAQYAEIRIRDIEEEAVKRKLSVGLAVLGAPDLVLLDEPTKGLDPVGRNQVWRILKELTSKESAIVMATNQMEDAELKADRTGIMIDGMLESIDPVDRIKRDKTDFYLKIEGIKKGENANLKEKILSLDKHFKVFQESAQERQLTFIIPKQKAKSNFWKVFEVIAEDLDKGEIRDFSFSEKSLSEVFEDIAKSAKHKKRDSGWSISL